MRFYRVRLALWPTIHIWKGYEIVLSRTSFSLSLSIRFLDVSVATRKKYFFVYKDDFTLNAPTRGDTPTILQGSTSLHRVSPLAKTNRSCFRAVIGPP